MLGQGCLGQLALGEPLNAASSVFLRGATGILTHIRSAKATLFMERTAASVLFRTRQGRATLTQ